MIVGMEQCSCFLLQPTRDSTHSEAELQNLSDFDAEL